MSYRGSTSASASAYKKSGHAKEDIFAKLIGGSTEGLPPQGKTDVRDKNGLNYSVKKHATANWQIFLYSVSRLKSDPDFLTLANHGLRLLSMLESFPADPDYYFRDKAILKSLLPDIKERIGKEGDLVGAIRTEIPDNEYFVSKVNLQKAAQQVAKNLKSPDIKRAFLSKAFFNVDEVQYLALENFGEFHIFPAAEVVECLLLNTTVETSGTGGHKTDLSLPGQKVLLRTDKNLMELEVRNEPLHYRELRMNVKRDVCFELLDSKFTQRQKRGALIYRSLL